MSARRTGGSTRCLQRNEASPALIEGQLRRSCRFRLKLGGKTRRDLNEIHEPLRQCVEPGLRLRGQDHALLAQDTRQRRLGAADEEETPRQPESWMLPPSVWLTRAFFVLCWITHC